MPVVIYRSRHTSLYTGGSAGIGLSQPSVRRRAAYSETDRLAPSATNISTA